MDPTPQSPVRHLRMLEARGTATVVAMALFDSLPSVQPEAMTGSWRGTSLRTGHRLDGLLERLHWYGKRFLGNGRAHPLLFCNRQGGLTAVDPARLPAGLARDLGPLFRNRAAGAVFQLGLPALGMSETAASLMRVEHRGVHTAAMIYDKQPIRDVFRRVDDDTLLGLMEMKRMSQPFFFVLRRSADQTGAVSRPPLATR